MALLVQILWQEFLEPAISIDLETVVRRTVHLAYHGIMVVGCSLEKSSPDIVCFSVLITMF
jgi:hypothetical protein